jgi:cell division protein FtsW (lipid II flippase)
MKTFKKIIGYLIVSLFAIMVICCFAYNIYTTGWYFIISLVIILALVGLLIFGIYLLGDSDQAE